MDYITVCSMKYELRASQSQETLFPWMLFIFFEIIDQNLMVFLWNTPYLLYNS